MDIFWKDPELIKGLSEDVRAYICDTMRRFAECWNQTYSEYKVSATIKDSLDNRLNREGLVEDHHSMTREQDEKKSLKVAHYAITPKGRKLLQGWLAFLSAFQ